MKKAICFPVLLSLLVWGFMCAPVRAEPKLSWTVDFSPQTRSPSAPMFATRLEIPLIRFGPQENSFLIELAHFFDSGGGVQFLRVGGSAGLSWAMSGLRARAMGFVYWYLVQGRGNPHGDERGVSQRLFWQVERPMRWFSIQGEVAYTVSRGNFWIGMGLVF